jgi:hypothetical protein
MSNKSKRRPSVPASGVQATQSGGTKGPKVGTKGSPLTKGKNTGGTKAGGDAMVQGASHQGSSLGKRSSG